MSAEPRSDPTSIAEYFLDSSREPEIIDLSAYDAVLTVDLEDPDLDLSAFVVKADELEVILDEVLEGQPRRGKAKVTRKKDQVAEFTVTWYAESFDVRKF